MHKDLPWCQASPLSVFHPRDRKHQSLSQNHYFSPFSPAFSSLGQFKIFHSALSIIKAMINRNPCLDCEKEFEDCYTDETRYSLLNVHKSHFGHSVQKWLGSHLLIANSLLFSFSLVMLLITSMRYHIPRDYCVRKLSFYCKSLQPNILSTENITVKGHLSNDGVAPALDLLNDNYKTVKFIGHTEEGSPYQGPPNAQVDAKWKHLTKGYSLKFPLPCFL